VATQFHQIVVFFLEFANIPELELWAFIPMPRQHVKQKNINTLFLKSETCLAEDYADPPAIERPASILLFITKLHSLVP